MALAHAALDEGTGAGPTLGAPGAGPIDGGRAAGSGGVGGRPPQLMAPAWNMAECVSWNEMRKYPRSPHHVPQLFFTSQYLGKREERKEKQKTGKKHNIQKSTFKNVNQRQPRNKRENNTNKTTSRSSFPSPFFPCGRGE